MSRKSNQLRRIGAALVAVIVLLPAPLVGADARDILVPLTVPGVYLAGVVFYAATPMPGDKPQQLIIRHGDLETLNWKAGSLSNIDAHVLVANTTRQTMPTISVRVSIYFGEVDPGNVPDEDEIFPGSPSIHENLFFERTYELKDLRMGSLGRISVHDIQLRAAIEESIPEGIWPAYVRVEGNLEKVPTGIDALRTNVSSFLKVVPGQ